MTVRPQATTFTGATLIRPNGLVPDSWITLADGVIRESGTGHPPAGAPSPIPLAGQYLAPGFIDLHVHGALGRQVGGDPAQLASALDTITTFHARHGTTALVATTVSEPLPRLFDLLGVIATHHDRLGQARLLGAHLEGPFLAADMCGAHNAAHLVDATPEVVHALLDAAGGRLRTVTLAPERDGGLAAVREFASAGVLVNIGHTNADDVLAGQAFNAGARGVTHLYNAMPGLHHRRGGLISEAWAHDQVVAEIICDGIHVAAPLIRAAFWELPRRVALITDASAAAGLPDGRHRLGDLPIQRRGSRVELADDPDTIAGSVLTMDAAVRGAVAAGIPLHVAVAAATAVPAGALNLDGTGTLNDGAAADLVVLDQELHVANTLIGGIPTRALPAGAAA